jgi:hypothetical protein
MRRLAPVPVLRMPRSAMAHSTSNSWACALAARRQQSVARKGQAAALQDFLQGGLRILAGVVGIDANHCGFIESLDHGAYRIETGIDKDRAENRLQGVGQNRGALRTTALKFAPRPDAGTRPD